MSDLSKEPIKNYEPLWDNWRVVRFIGEGTSGRVYEIRREEDGDVYTSAAKIISVPQNKEELKEVSAEHTNTASVKGYFDSAVSSLKKEIRMMSKFKGITNIVSFDDHAVYEHPDGIGATIIIRMELLTPLQDYFANKPIDEKTVQKIGIDIATALTICHKEDVIHRDIKPSNIFISRFGDYKLGDFGVSRENFARTRAATKQGTEDYMAPEIYRGHAYNQTIDIYSLGIVLYRLANGNRLPFLPPAPAPIVIANRREAFERRMTGEALPEIPGINKQLMTIISKATAANPKRRYSSARDLLADLKKIDFRTQKTPKTKKPRRRILPKQAKAKTPKTVQKQPARKDPITLLKTFLASIKIPKKPTPAKKPDKPTEDEEKRKKLLLVIICSVGIILIILLLWLLFRPNYGLILHRSTEESQSSSTDPDTDTATDQPATDTNSPDDSDQSTDPDAPVSNDSQNSTTPPSQGSSTSTPKNSSTSTPNNPSTPSKVTQYRYRDKVTTTISTGQADSFGSDGVTTFVGYNGLSWAVGSQECSDWSNWSDWVVIGGAGGSYGAQCAIEEQWKYDDSDTIYSSAPEYRSGHTLKRHRTKTTVRYQIWRWGDWSSWSTTPATKTSTREVETRQV